MAGMEFAPVRHALTITLVQQLSAHSNNFDGLLIVFLQQWGWHVARCDQVCKLPLKWYRVKQGQGKFPRGPDRACIFVTADLLEFGFVFHS